MKNGKILIILGIVLLVLSCTSTIVYLALHCDKNPQAAVCQDSLEDGQPLTNPEDCDHDDSVAKGDMECIGIPGKEGTNKPVTVKTQGTVKTSPNKGNTTTTRKFK